jgi:hypothetical protein
MGERPVASSPSVEVVVEVAIRVTVSSFLGWRLPWLAVVEGRSGAVAGFGSDDGLTGD